MVFPSNMIRLRGIFLIFIFLLSGCASFEAWRENLTNLIPNKLDHFYFVEKGDSVWSIALKFNLDPQSIITNNNIEKPYIIYPNQKLTFNKEINESALVSLQPPKQWHAPLNGDAKPEITASSWLIYKQKQGEPIHSVYAGKVVVSGPDIPGYGNLVMISHSDGYLSLYAHCDKIFVESGDEVSKGMMIAHVGNSEASYPMLRFQLRKNGKPIQASQLQF
jgi:lipoprotein NlpD